MVVATLLADPRVLNFGFGTLLLSTSYIPVWAAAFLLLQSADRACHYQYDIMIQSFTEQPNDGMTLETNHLIMRF